MCWVVQQLLSSHMWITHWLRDSWKSLLQRVVIPPKNVQIFLACKRNNPPALWISATGILKLGLQSRQSSIYVYIFFRSPWAEHYNTSLWSDSDWNNREADSLHREMKLVEENSGKQSDSIPTLNSVLQCEDTELPAVKTLSWKIFKE